MSFRFLGSWLAGALWIAGAFGCHAASRTPALPLVKPSPETQQEPHEKPGSKDPNPSTSQTRMSNQDNKKPSWREFKKESLTDAELRARLTPEQYKVTQREGTERP